MKFNVHGISITLNSPLDKFVKFVEKNYESFKLSGDSSVEIKVIFSEESGKNVMQLQDRMKFFGEGIYLTNNELSWRNQYGFVIRIKKKATNKFLVEAYHHDLINKTDQEERYKDFQRSMRWAIHFPVFTVLRYRRGWQLIHASGIAREDKAVLFCGTNQVGKSTLASKLCLDAEYDLLSDNFLLVSEDTVLQFPEVVRMKEDVRTKLDITEFFQQKVYDKFHVPPAEFGVADQAVPTTCFFMGRGSVTECKPRSARPILQSMENLQAKMGEFPDQSFFALWPYVFSGDEEKKTLDDSKPLLNSDWYELTQQFNWELQSTLDEIRPLIP